MFRQFKRLFLLCLLVISSSLIFAQDTPTVPASQVSGLQTIGRTLDTINLRSGAGTTYPILDTLPINSQVVIEARNSFGNWVIVHTVLPTGLVRGWAASRYVAWPDSIEVDQLSPSAEIIVPGVPPAPPAGGAPVTDGTTLPANPPVAPDVPAAPVQPPADSNVPVQPNVPAVAPAVLPPLPVDTPVGRTKDILNVRAGAGTRFPILEEIEYNAAVLIEGRTADSRWFLIRSQNNVLRGWIASRYVSVSALVDTERLPIFDGSVPASQLGAAIPSAPSAPVANGDGESTTGGGNVAPPVSAPVVATGDLAAIQNELGQMPVLPVVTEKTRFIYQLGLASGANPRHFIKVGVNVVNNANYLTPVGQGVNYGAYPWLKYTVDFFQQGDYNSWTATPVLGSQTGGLLDANSLPPNCPAGNTTPIDCAAAARGAGFAVVYVGTIDSVSGITPAQFSAALNGVVSQLANRGTIPLLTTIPIKDGLDRTTVLQYNKIIIDTAAQYGAPVLNYYRVALDLPGNGLDNVGIGFTASNQKTANFGGEKDTYGYDALNFYTTWALSTILGGL